jgi:hypothetical protein
MPIFSSFSENRIPSRFSFCIAKSYHLGLGFSNSLAAPIIHRIIHILPWYTPSCIATQFFIIRVRQGHRKLTTHSTTMSTNTTSIADACYDLPDLKHNKDDVVALEILQLVEEVKARRQ